MTIALEEAIRLVAIKMKWSY